MTIIDMAENLFPTLRPDVLQAQIKILETLHFTKIIFLILLCLETLTQHDHLLLLPGLLFLIILEQKILQILSGKPILFPHGLDFLLFFRNIEQLPIELLMMYLALKGILCFDEPAHQDKERIVPFDARADYGLIFEDELLVEVAFAGVPFLKLLLRGEIV